MHAITLTTISSTELPIPGVDPWYANPTDPAISVMTDFRDRASVTVSDGATIAVALAQMIHAGVRCAFAIDEEQRVVVGLITAYDITSEKPQQYLQAAQPARREVLVRDIMQPVCEWRVADVSDIQKGTVASLAGLFDEAGVTHIPVMERSDKGAQRLRGLLSAAKVKRVLAK